MENFTSFLGIEFVKITNDPNVHGKLVSFITSKNFSCVAAKTAIHNQTLIHRDYKGGDISEFIDTLYSDVHHFGMIRLILSKTQSTFVATFSEIQTTDEATFGRLFWAIVNQLHKLDIYNEYQWAQGFDSDPESKNFAFSLQEEAYFLVGINPNATRISRRFDYPGMVFNSHQQFKYLKEARVYGRLQKAIRNREIALQGYLNPNLSDFGESSEAKQYSGVPIDNGWECPFHSELI